MDLHCADFRDDFRLVGRNSFIFGLLYFGRWRYKNKRDERTIEHLAEIFDSYMQLRFASLYNEAITIA